MEQRRTRHRERIALLCGLLCLGMAGLTGRLFFLMTCRADEYSSMATELHQRADAEGGQRQDFRQKRDGDCR